MKQEKIDKIKEAVNIYEKRMEQEKIKFAQRIFEIFTEEDLI